MHQHIVVSILDPGAVRMMRGVKADKCHNSERSRALRDNIGLVGKCWAPDCGQWLQISHVAFSHMWPVVTSHTQQVLRLVRAVRYARDLQLIATGAARSKSSSSPALACLCLSDSDLHQHEVSCLILSLRTFLWSVLLLVMTIYVRNFEQLLRFCPLRCCNDLCVVVEQGYQRAGPPDT